MYSLFVLWLCKLVTRARSVVKASQPVIGGDQKEMEQIVAFSSDTGIKPRGDETGPECMCWIDKLLLFVSTVTWLHRLMRKIIVRVVRRSLTLWQNTVVYYNQLYIYSFCGSILDYIQRFRRNLHLRLRWHTLLPDFH